MRRMSAPEDLITSCGRHRVAERLRHLAAVLVEHEAVGEHDVERRHAAGAAAFEQRGVEPAAVLVGAFEIHHGVGAAVLAAADAGEARKVFRVLQHEGMGRAGIEPDVENVVDLAASPRWRARRGSARARRPRTRRRRPRCSKAVGDAGVRRASSLRISAEPSPFSRTNTAIGTPQARWRETTQSGRPSIMPVMRFSPCGGTQRVALMASSARWRRVSPGLRACRPLSAIGLSMAMNHCGVLRKITGFLERQECGYWCFKRPRATSMPASIKRLDHGLVGIALFALVGDDALRLAGYRAGRSPAPGR